MLQILGHTLLIATRNDAYLPDHRNQPARLHGKEPEERRVRRQGWLRLGGLFL